MIFDRPRLRQGLEVGPTFNSRGALDPWARANQPSEMGLGFPHRAERYRPGESPFPRGEGVDVVRYFLCGMGYYPPLSSSVAAELRRCPDGQLSQRAGSMGPEPISHHWMGVWFPHRAGRWGWGTHTVRSGIDRENHRFRPRVECVEVLRYL